jgi:hypothetical protein
MRKIIFAALVCILATGAAMAQKSAEVLYFKANLPCCKARSCNAMQSEVEKAVNKYFAGQGIGFRTIMLSDAANAELVKKHAAKSQTVVFVNTKGRKEKVVDLSAAVKGFLSHYDSQQLEAELKAAIESGLK